MIEEEKAIYVRILSKIVGMFLKMSNMFYNWAGLVRYHIFMTVFGSRDEDVWIVTYPKSGTTVMQMILYQLTTLGNMEFRHINDVCPWVRNAAVRGLKPTMLPDPRILKSHDKYNFFDNTIKGRFVFVIRDGRDVAVSYFHQLKNYNNPSLEFDEVFRKSFSDLKGDSWYAFNRDWLRNKKGRQVLYIKYEDIIEDKRAVIARLIEFLNLSVDDEAIERAIQRSSFEYMKLHEDKFGIEKIQDHKVYDQFIRKGVSGEGKSYFSEQQELKFDSLYEHNIRKLMKLRF
jgi:hypothetical protein